VRALLFLLAGCDGVFGLDTVPTRDIDAAPDAPTTYVQAVLADHPLAYYRLDEATGVVAASAIVGAPQGTYTGKVQLGVAGALGGDADTALAVDYANPGAVDLGDVFDFAGSAPFSIEAWVKPAAFDANYHMIASKWQQPPNRKGIELFHLDDEIRFTRELDDSTIDVANAHGLSATAWTHVVGTYDGAMLRLYFNGMQVDASASSLSLPDISESFEIGVGGNAFYGGAIDEVAIYGTALAPERVFAHHAAATGG
jgi:hypothetical protein